MTRGIPYRFIPRPACPMCGQADAGIHGMRLDKSQGRRPRTVSGVGVTVKKCRACELIFADPMPAPLDLSDHYGLPPEAYWTPEYFTVSEDYFAAEISAAKRMLGGASGKVALDIGAGIGKGMVALTRAGFDTWGIEPSPSFRERALAGGEIAADRLQRASIEDAVFPPATFDLITFGAVLEHIQEPGEALVRALGWLKTGGVIQAEVPSSRHLIAKLANVFFALQGLNYVTNISPMHPPYHLYEFGLKSFEKHGRRFGYSVAEHSYQVAPIYHLPKLLHPPLRALMRATDSGMQLTVWIRKNA
jgi:ubiquinone/menaquinone biosynthesis C-methylase UbiE